MGQLNKSPTIEKFQKVKDVLKNNYNYTIHILEILQNKKMHIKQFIQ